MKKSRVNLSALADGEYYYCANCDYWYNQRHPLPDQLCPDCQWAWQNARGVYRTTTLTPVVAPPRPDYSSDWLIIFTLLIVGVAIWAFFAIQKVVQQTWSQLQAAWTGLVEGTALWLGLAIQTVLPYLILIGVTILLFFLFERVLHVGLTSFQALTAALRRDRSLPAARVATRSDRLLVGSVANLLSSLAALVLVAWLLLPPDYWLLGVQFVMALLIELTIFEQD